MSGLPDDAWSPVSLAWSLVRAGDVILAGPTRLPWIIVSVGPAGEVVAVRGVAPHRATPDPTATVEVLCPGRRAGRTGRASGGTRGADRGTETVTAPAGGSPAPAGREPTRRKTIV